MKNKIIILLGILFSIPVLAQETPECKEDVGDKMCLVEMEGKYGIIDKKGRYVVPAYFDSIEVFGKGFIVRQNGKYGVIDRKGKIEIPIEYMNIKCAGNCEDDFIFEVQNIGVKSIFISKDYDRLFSFNKISPTLFAKTTEISILDYFTFVKDVKDNGYNYNYGYETVLPDTNKVEEKLKPVYRAFMKGLNEEGELLSETVTFAFQSSKRMETFYQEALVKNKQKEMMNFPVTGISYKQAEKYTNWMSIIFREIVDANDLELEVKFRLPTLEEWETMALSGLSDEMKNRGCLDSLNEKGCMLVNFDAKPNCKNYDDYIKNSFGKGSSFVFSFNPDLNGLYNVFGNVAEMLNENGVAKGGSYFHSAKKAQVTHSIEFEEPQPWLGFRVVAELKARNN